ncbi:MAG TPA: ABC transporter permease [Pseudonocardia sp.]|jgi:ABC-type dipeptide/oligopeptide/nickel transport system permease component|uniref:ABC transporter permease n=1 Tax=Pseudonocardia sp. TaxID=60912 RepID=UPI002C7AEF6D|nr:ABC transporter permease [Pseudonocardia sp.]HTF48754.1 ABC transporter permease [Pseudonocardia sp.]
MLRYIVRRVLVAIPLLIVASILTFALTTAMGDPLAEWKTLRARTPAEVTSEYHRIGWDRSPPERYLDWAGGFVKGDWGATISPGSGTLDVRGEIGRALGVTLQLVIVAEVLALLIGMAVGALGAVRQYSWFDYGATGAAFVMFSMPLFCVAVILKFGGIQLNNWLESLGLGRWIITAGPPQGGFSGGFGQLLYEYSGAFILPVLSLIAIQFALFSRYQRASMLDALNADYVRTARAKGLSSGRVVIRHALRNGLIPVVTVFALDLSLLIGGAVITETVFGWRGMGALIVDAITKREPWMVQGWMMVTAIVIIAFNLIADLVYAYLDPRIRLG